MRSLISVSIASNAVDMLKTERSGQLSKRDVGVVVENVGWRSRRQGVVVCFDGFPRRSVARYHTR